jgi:pimeloyl-ACP methyl ester carboxylesterase
MRGHLEMWPLRRHLAAAGFAPQQFSYPSLRQPIEVNSSSLAAMIATLNGRRYHLVAHSLGGIVVMETLRRHGSAGLQRIVTLGSPLTGSGVAHSMNRHALTRWPLGRSRQALLDGAPALPPGIEVGSIAGNLAMGIGRLLAHHRDQPGDGSVSVAETRAAGLSDHITLPLSHSGLQMSALAAKQTIAFLRNGRFEHPV